MNVNKLLIFRFDRESYQAKIPTKSGNFVLSIVAGEHLYCTPRESMREPNYTEVELAIFDKNGNWASYNQAKPAFEILGTTGEYSGTGNSDEPQSSVFGWVPVDKIENLINTL